MVVTRAVRGLLGDEISGEIDVEAPLMEMGLDSLAATELVRELSEEFGARLSPTLLFDFPTITAISKHLASLVRGAAENSFVVLEEEPSFELGGDVAIVGMSCRFPGGIEGPGFTISESLNDSLMDFGDARALGGERE